MGISASAPWLAFYGNTPATLDYPRKTMYQVVAETARRYPGNTAYIFMGKETSFEAFARRIDAAAKGLSRGDILMTLNGKQVTSLDILEQIIYASAPGDELKATVYRDGKEFAVTIIVGEDKH